ncbi:hypothetical protein [Leucobacter japonicus]|uniref:hypothetical protein n=1 Tax=Leucobacter japonicus TaxID=1461259 RepID=UPI0006A7664A|nr:hypothetical protein [Leucobacter japonicus]
MSAISYSVKGAAEATGVSEPLVRQAIKDGDVVVRYWNSKQLIEHDELKRLVQSLPTEKPEVA